MRNRQYPDRVTIVGQDGIQRGEIRAAVDTNCIITQDADILVEVGDTVERELPHGRKEILSVTGVQFWRDGGRTSPGFYEIAVERADASGRRSGRPDVAVYVSDSPHTHVNVESVDNSIYEINVQAREVFQETRELINTGVTDSNDRSRLLESVDAMEATHQTGDFIASYKNFIGLAADHISLLGPAVALLTTLL